MACSRKAKSALTVAVLLAGAPLAVLAQSSPPPPSAPPQPTTTGATPGKQASISYLSRRYGISNAEAERRLALQGEAVELRHRLSAALGDKFARVRLQHTPEFRVIVETLDLAAANGQLGNVSSNLRAALQFVQVSRSAADVQARIGEISGLLRAGGLASQVGFDPASDNFHVVVGDQNALLRARALLPAALLADTDLKVGMLPSDIQAGYVSGDYTYGGWQLFNNSSPDPLCTSGFVVRLSDARYGVTTAGHCSQSNRLWVNGHYVTLTGVGTPYDGGLYDYRVYLTGSLTISGHVAYNNNQPIRGYPDLINSVPGYADAGYFAIKDGLYQTGVGYNDVVCKSGQRTHLTCGEVVDTYINYTTSDGKTRNGMVAVGYSYERVPGYQGDSGGPVFMEEPEGFVRPVGLMSSANGPSGGGPCDTTKFSGCQFFFMPVDRINDQQPMQLKTQGGHLNPT